MKWSHFHFHWDAHKTALFFLFPLETFQVFKSLKKPVVWFPPEFGFIFTAQVALIIDPAYHHTGARFPLRPFALVTPLPPFPALDALVSPSGCAMDGPSSQPASPLIGGPYPCPRLRIFSCSEDSMKRYGGRLFFLVPSFLRTPVAILLIDPPKGTYGRYGAWCIDCHSFF